MEMIQTHHWNALTVPVIATTVVLLASCGSNNSQPGQQEGGIQSAAQATTDVVVYDLIPWSFRPVIGPGEGSVLQYRNPYTSTPPILLGLAGTMELVAVDASDFAFAYEVRNVHFRTWDLEGPTVWTLEGPGTVGYFRASPSNPETPLEARLTLTSNRGGGSETVELAGGGGPETFTVSAGLPSFDAVRLRSENGYSISLSAVARQGAVAEQAR